MKCEQGPTHEPGWSETALILATGLLASWGLFNLVGIAFGVLASTSPAFPLADAVRAASGDAGPYAVVVLVASAVGGIVRVRWTRTARRSCQQDVP